MFDFVRIVDVDTPKKGRKVVKAKFITMRVKDLMIRGGEFYAAWLEDEGRWTTDYDDVLERIDTAIMAKTEELRVKQGEYLYSPELFCYADSGAIDAWLKFTTKQLKDNHHILNQSILFADHEIKREDYASFKLDYTLTDDEAPGYEKLISTLYSPEERHKLEWSIGSIVTGDAKVNQKFAILYGAAGTGKSTMLNIIEKLFKGYCATFDANALGSRNDQFSMEAFTDNPLVAIQHDGDLSRIEDNSRINSLVSHEKIRVNEKFKRTYANQFNTFLFLGTNKYVKITDAKSGLIRRLIDITPSGNLLKKRDYNAAVKQVDFELGAIANHCRKVYLEDPNYYDDYVPYSMLSESNDFYNFMTETYKLFRKEDEVTLSQAWSLYKEFVESSKQSYMLNYRQFRTEILAYFKEVVPDENGQISKTALLRNFDIEKFPGLEKSKKHFCESKATDDDWLIFEEQGSVLDTYLADYPAQLAKKKDETPMKSWDKVRTTLSSIDTHEIHYVRPPLYLIVLDFDLKVDGEKNFEKNKEAASKFPPTYAELSKSGHGIHLHYIYNGDPTELSSIFGEDIEVKVFSGKSSLRRKLTKCNTLPIANISSGLPKKETKKMLNTVVLKDENHLRSLIKKALAKKIHAHTTPNVDYIRHILDEAYASGISYDVDDMHQAVLYFATQSTNQADKCLQQVRKMKWKSKDVLETESTPPAPPASDTPLIFFDLEVYPNLFLVGWKEEGEGKSVITMINPDAKEIENLVKHRLIGFNNRRYDNHILYARILGYDNAQLFELSTRIVKSKKGDRNNGLFGNAYNISYTDVYDFAAKKQSLKKWEIELGIHHEEWGLPWDQSVPEELWDKVAAYCANDVLATEAVFNFLHDDFTGRLILADLAGGTPNDTTNTLTTKLIFGNERHPELNYVDLATGEASNPKYQRTDIITAFPTYEYKGNRNIYRGVDVGRGGYILSNPGVYSGVKALDIASMHPHSAIAMNQFGAYTQGFKDLVDARIAIKHNDMDAVAKLFDGKLTSYLDKGDVHPKQLAQALKIAINSVYGLTAASFDNPFRDKRNVNNTVALRGALFMKTLQDEVEARGFKIVAIKTDSIKIADATDEIVNFCMEFAQKYGYTFEIDDEFDRICQINDADYIARDHDDIWHATGAKFAEPVVFKTLFSHEEMIFDDYVETKSVSGGAIYMATDTEPVEDPLNHLDQFRFIGRVSSFVAVKPEHGGREIFRVDTEKGQFGYVNGTKGYFWMEAEQLRAAGKMDILDMDYYRTVVDSAKDAISEYCDFDNFVSHDDLILVGPWYAPDEDTPPWDDPGADFAKR